MAIYVNSRCFLPTWHLIDWCIFGNNFFVTLNDFPQKVMFMEVYENKQHCFTSCICPFSLYWLHYCKYYPLAAPWLFLIEKNILTKSRQLRAKLVANTCSNPHNSTCHALVGKWRFNMLSLIFLKQLVQSYKRWRPTRYWGTHGRDIT